MSEWRVSDPDPIEFTYPESLLVYAALQREARWRRRRLEVGQGAARHEQRKLERALSAIAKLDAASNHPAARAASVVSPSG